MIIIATLSDKRQKWPGMLFITGLSSPEGLAWMLQDHQRGSMYSYTQALSHATVSSLVFASDTLNLDFYDGGFK